LLNGNLNDLKETSEIGKHKIVFIKFNIMDTIQLKLTNSTRGCCGRDRMVVGFTTTNAISA
jgi:hypothetical protein